MTENQETIPHKETGYMRLAKVLNLKIPPVYDPVEAIELDIKRLQHVERLWSAACNVARVHCPVGIGEDHIQQGIPRLAREANRLRERNRQALACLSAIVYNHDENDHVDESWWEEARRLTGRGVR